MAEIDQSPAAIEFEQSREVRQYTPRCFDDSRRGSCSGKIFNEIGDVGSLSHAGADESVVPVSSDGLPLDKDILHIEGDVSFDLERYGLAQFFPITEWEIENPIGE